MNVFLIDADNLNSGAWLDEAFRVLDETEGPLSVRRAYGSAENLKGLAESLRAWAVRPFVNLALTKNTTDIALAVDAMELACHTPAPRMIVIGSGDADFVPLVVRLRERGIRVVCVAERSKMAREAVSAYARVILVGQEQGSHEVPVAASDGLAPVGRRTAAKKSPSMKTATVKTPVRKAAVKKAVAKAMDQTLDLFVAKAVEKAADDVEVRGGAKGPAKGQAKGRVKPEAATDAPAVVKGVSKSGAKSAANNVPAGTATPEQPMPVVQDNAAAQHHALDVAAILLAVPALQSGLPQPLAAVAKALLDAKLRGKNMTTTKLLKKFPHHFALLPHDKPRTVTYAAPKGGDSQ